MYNFVRNRRYGIVRSKVPDDTLSRVISETMRSCEQTAHCRTRVTELQQSHRECGNEVKSVYWCQVYSDAKRTKTFSNNLSFMISCLSRTAVKTKIKIRFQNHFAKSLNST